MERGFNRGYYGKAEATRMEGIAEKENSERFGDYMDKHFSTPEEKREKKKEFAEFQTDTGVNDLDITRKVLELVNKGDLTMEEAKSVAPVAEKQGDLANYINNQNAIDKAMEVQIANVLREKFPNHPEEEIAARAKELRKKKSKAIEKLLS